MRETNGHPWRLLIDRDDIARAEIDAGPAEAPGLAGGGIAVTLGRCGLSANNVTYAALGNAFKAVSADIGYWGFFPLAAGAAMTPARVSATGLIDASTHRRSPIRVV